MKKITEFHLHIIHKGIHRGFCIKNSVINRQYKHSSLQLCSGFKIYQRHFSELRPSFVEYYVKVFSDLKLSIPNLSKKTFS